jgi:hypothetical protein
MGGRRAQVALFVLIGFVILLGVVLLIVAVNNQRAAVGEDLDVVDEVSDNPEVAAERARMRERVDTCLQEIAKEAVTDFAAAGVPVATSAEANPYLAEEISLNFPSCFYRFNTRSKLEIIDPEAPRVEASLGNTMLIVDVDYLIRGHYEGESYTFSDHHAEIETNLAALIEQQQLIDEQLSNPSEDGFITPDGFVDPYAFEDEGIYTDIVFYDDGSCLIFFYDYNTEPPLLSSRYYETCLPG